MATQTEKEALAMLARVRFASAEPLTYKQAGDIIIRMAADIQRERKHVAMNCILSA